MKIPPVYVELYHADGRTNIQTPYSTSDIPTCNMSHQSLPRCLCGPLTNLSFYACIFVLFLNKTFCCLRFSKNLDKVLIQLIIVLEWGGDGD